MPNVVYKNLGLLWVFSISNYPRPEATHSGFWRTTPPAILWLRLSFEWTLRIIIIMDVLLNLSSPMVLPSIKPV